MVQAIQVLRFHLLELEKVSTALLGSPPLPLSISISITEA